MKYCRLCRLPRPAEEKACSVCDHTGFAESALSMNHPSDASLVEGRVTSVYLELEAEVAQGREDFETLRRLGWLAWAIDDIRAVDVWCHEASRHDRSSPEPHLLLGLVLRAEKRWHEAWEEFSVGLNRPGLDEERRAQLERYRDEVAALDPEQ